MWTLPKINFPRAALKSGLERMREASHGAMTTDQTHASGSIMMRMHNAYGDRTTRYRAFAFQARTLLMPSEFERKAQMIQAAEAAGEEPEQAVRGRRGWAT